MVAQEGQRQQQIPTGNDRKKCKGKGEFEIWKGMQMTTTVTADQLIRRAIGTSFPAVFGAIWLLLGLYVRESLSTVSLSAVICGLLVLLCAALWLRNQAWRFPREEESEEQKKARSRGFLWVNAVQWVAIAIVANGCARLHLDAYVFSGITAIVGLHMFPLARLFRYPLHYANCAVLTGWGVLSAVVAPVEHLQGVTALGTGSILWVSTATSVGIAMLAVRRAGVNLGGVGVSA